MDYFQGVVTEYLRADRSVFVNTECLIHLDEGSIYAKERHWYCDAVAINFREETVSLCEITFSKTLGALVARLALWSRSWPDLCEAIYRDCKIPRHWKIQPLAFVPEESASLLRTKFASAIAPETTMPPVAITFLEATLPWKYCTWDRKEHAFASDA